MEQHLFRKYMLFGFMIFVHYRYCNGQFQIITIPNLLKPIVKAFA